MQSAIQCLRTTRFHDLRHAHATHLLASGTHPKVASERLGLSEIGITLDLYSHVMPGMQEAAAANADAALQVANEKAMNGSKTVAVQESQNIRERTFQVVSVC